MPDFCRHDATGQPWFFYDLFDGRALLLVAFRTLDRAALDRFTAFCATSGLGLRCVAIVAVPPRALAAAGVAVDEQSLVLADDGTVVEWLLGRTTDAENLFLIDPNQRLLERCSLDPDDAVASSARFAAALAGAHVAAPAVIGGGAPALIVPRVLEPALCAELISLFRREGGDPSGVRVLSKGKAEFKVDPAQKQRRDYHSFDAAWNSRLTDLLRRRLLPEVDKCFGFRATTYEEFKLACYDAGEGGYHRPHRDNVTADVADRRFAMSINLNTGGYEGGQLRFPEYGPTLYLPPLGGAVVFSSSMLHEALPVTRGQRFVLLTFFSNDAARGPHRYHEPR